MATNVATGPRACQSATADSTVEAERALICLRQAVQESGWTHEALAAAMDCSPSLVTRILLGERPLTQAWEVRLPDDVERLYLQKRAESMDLLCVAPLTGLAAQKAFVAGLIGVMSAPAPLPDRASAMVRTDRLLSKKGVA